MQSKSFSLRQPPEAILTATGSGDVCITAPYVNRTFTQVGENWLLAECRVHVEVPGVCTEVEPLPI